jgi:hypothetical protein
MQTYEKRRHFLPPLPTGSGGSGFEWLAARKASSGVKAKLFLRQASCPQKYFLH